MEVGRKCMEEIERVLVVIDYKAAEMVMERLW